MQNLSFPIILSAFLVVFAAELPDKTAIAIVALSIRHKVAGVLAGAFAAFAIQTIVGVVAGGVLLFLPQKLIHIATALAFIIFAVVVFTRNKEKELKEEEKKTEKGFNHHKKAFMASFLVVFAAEWGDLSQIATAFLVAKTKNPFSVGTGAILALWIVAVMAILLGKKLAQKLTLKKLNLISGLILLIVGTIMLVSAI